MKSIKGWFHHYLTQWLLQKKKNSTKQGIWLVGFWVKIFALKCLLKGMCVFVLICLLWFSGEAYPGNTQDLLLEVLIGSYVGVGMNLDLLHANLPAVLSPSLKLTCFCWKQFLLFKAWPSRSLAPLMVCFWWARIIIFHYLTGALRLELCVLSPYNRHSKAWLLIICFWEN